MNFKECMIILVTLLSGTLLEGMYNDPNLSNHKTKNEIIFEIVSNAIEETLNNPNNCRLDDTTDDIKNNKVPTANPPISLLDVIYKYGPKTQKPGPQ